jgi:cell division septation protein DedD
VETPSEQVARQASGLPEGWAVRLGVFADTANAEKLLKQLVDADHKAYARRMGADRTAVFVGPVLSRAEANRLVGELSDRFQLNGMVVRFEIETPR